MPPDAGTGGLQPRDPLAAHAATPVELQQLISAEKSGEAFLACRDEHGRLRLIVLEASTQRIAVGRHPSAGVSIPWDGEVSGLHAELEYAGGEWVVSDDGLSRNGTFVNEQRVLGRRRLRDGDRLRVGKTIVAVHTPGPAVLARTALPGGASEGLDVTPAQKRVLVALCRPVVEGASFAAPATNKRIAEELCLSIDTIKDHLGDLFTKLGIDPEASNKRRLLAELALNRGLVTLDDLHPG